MTEKHGQQEKSTLMILLFALWGLILLLVTCLPLPFVLFPIEIYFLLFGLGAGLVFTAFGMSLKLSKVSKETLKRLKQDRRGALWIWAVCLLAIVTLAMGWFTLTWPAFIIIDTIESKFDFPPEATAPISLIKAVMGWFLIFMSLGLLLWAFVHSQRREEVTYPV